MNWPALSFTGLWQVSGENNDAPQDCRHAPYSRFSERESQGVGERREQRPVPSRHRPAYALHDLLAQANDPDPKVRRRVAKELENDHFGEATNALVELLGDAEHEVRMPALILLGDKPGPEVTAAMLSCLLYLSLDSTMVSQPALSGWLFFIKLISKANLCILLVTKHSPANRWARQEEMNMKVFVVGRHSGDIPGCDVVKAKNVSFPTSGVEQVVILLDEIAAEASSAGAEAVVFQTTPAVLVEALLVAYEGDGFPMPAYAVVSTLGLRPAGVRTVHKFSSSEDAAAALLAVQAANPNVKATAEGCQLEMVLDPPMKFVFDRLARIV